MSKQPTAKELAEWQAATKKATDKAWKADKPADDKKGKK